MKKTLFKILATAVSCAISILLTNSCSKGTPTPDPTPDPTPTQTIQVGSYVWGATIYNMGEDGAEYLAEAFEKAGIGHTILLVKGVDGTVGYQKNTLSGVKKALSKRDLLSETITAMHAHGIKVYAWIIIGKDDTYLAQFPKHSSYHFRRGYSCEDVDLSQKDYQEFVGKIVMEIDQNYDVDGFAFDMARFAAAYFGWAESDYQRLTAPKSEGGYGLTLDQYNNAVSLLAREYGYPTSKNKDGRLVHDVNAEVPEVTTGIFFSAYSQGDPGVVAFGKMREKIVDEICEYLVSKTDKPSFVASMPECSYAPEIATLSYGMTFNKAYTFDVVCPMLYSAEYQKTDSWVKWNIDYLKNLGYGTILPSLQAYSDASTVTLAADIKASIDAGCKGYLLFRTGTYDMAKSRKTKDGAVELTYVRGTDDSCGKITITSTGTTPTSVIMGGKFASTQYNINDQTITFNANALQALGDYGTITINFSDVSKLSALNVKSDARIVYNAPLDF